MPNQHKIINWESILDSIESGKTIVCIGAEIFNNGEMTLTEQFKTILQVSDNSGVRMYDDGLFHFKSSSDTIAYTQIKRFYKQQNDYVANILEKLAAIKIPIIISLNPDWQLKSAFEKIGVKADYQYYFRKKPAPNIAEPSVENPLIYNLMGDIDRRESMILTYNDLFDYFESVVEHKSMPEHLKESIKEAYNFIFIGLPFDRWYMQMLLRVLGQHNNSSVLKYASNYAMNEKTESFCREQFNITCVPTQIPEFIDELFEQCKTAGLIRTTENDYVEPTFYNLIRQKLRKDELREVIDDLSEEFENNYADDQASNNLLIQLSGRLTRLDSRLQKGNISEDNAKVERAEIRNALTSFFDDFTKTLKK